MKQVSLRDDIFKYLKKTYNSEIENLWFKFPNYAVFRNDETKKWYGIIMDIPYSKLGINKDGIVDVLNVKVNGLMLKEALMKEQGIFNGYHISRGNWISILLDGTISKDQLFALIDDSFKLTRKNAKLFN